MSTNQSVRLSFVTEFVEYHTSQVHGAWGMLRIKAPELDETGPSHRPPVDVVACLDCSTSMKNSRMDLLKQTMRFMINVLSEEDRLGITTYSTRAGKCLDLILMDEDGKKKAHSFVDDMVANGLTNLSDGLFKAIDLMEKREKKASVSSILLMTDGEVNCGVCDVNDLVNIIKGKLSIDEWSISDSNKSNVEMDMFNVGPMTNNVSLSNVPSNVFPPSNVINVQSNVINVQSNVPSNVFPPPNVINVQSNVPSNVFPPPNVINVQSNLFSNVAPVNPLPMPSKIESFITTKIKKNIDYTEQISIHTFGYGTEHAVDFLKTIASNSHGMYFDINSPSVIGEAFVNCLGGLLSTVCSKVKIFLESKHPCLIDKVHTGFPLKTQSPGKYEIEMYDLQSEEQKDLVFQFSIPPVSQEGKYPSFSARMTFLDHFTEEITTNHCDGTVSRVRTVSNKDPNVDVDEQKNRIKAHAAMEEAIQLTNKGEFTKGKKVLDKISSEIKQSASRKQSSTYLADIQEARDLMDPSSWHKGGHAYSENVNSGWSLQRSNALSKASGNRFANKKRKELFSKFHQKS